MNKKRFIYEKEEDTKRKNCKKKERKEYFGRKYDKSRRNLKKMNKEIWKDKSLRLEGRNKIWRMERKIYFCYYFEFFQQNNFNFI